MRRSHDAGSGREALPNGTRRTLLDAIERVCRSASSPSIAAVAREAGVSAALIHNRYPDLAVSIRALSGRQKRDEAAQLRTALTEERAISKALRDENSALLADLRALASVNETLRQELALRKAVDAPNVVQLRPRNRRS